MRRASAQYSHSSSSTLLRRDWSGGAVRVRWPLVLTPADISAAFNSRSAHGGRRRSAPPRTTPGVKWTQILMAERLLRVQGSVRGRSWGTCVNRRVLTEDRTARLITAADASENGLLLPIEVVAGVSSAVLCPPDAQRLLQRYVLRRAAGSTPATWSGQVVGLQLAGRRPFRSHRGACRPCTGSAGRRR
jgi:hypothetical protein